jgi:hypothetical protein
MISVCMFCKLVQYIFLYSYFLSTVLHLILFLLPPLRIDSHKRLVSFNAHRKLKVALHAVRSAIRFSHWASSSPSSPETSPVIHSRKSSRSPVASPRGSPMASPRGSPRGSPRNSFSRTAIAGDQKKPLLPPSSSPSSSSVDV